MGCRCAPAHGASGLRTAAVRPVSALITDAAAATTATGSPAPTRRPCCPGHPPPQAGPANRRHRPRHLAAPPPRARHPLHPAELRVLPRERSRLRLMAVTIETAVYPRSGLGWRCRLRLFQVLVWRTSRACSAARVMLSLMKSRKRAMFSRRAAAGVRGPRMATPWRAVSASWSLDRALAIVAW